MGKEISVGHVLIRVCVGDGTCLLFASERKFDGLAEYVTVMYAVIISNSLCRCASRIYIARNVKCPTNAITTPLNRP